MAKSKLQQTALSQAFEILRSVAERMNAGTDDYASRAKAQRVKAEDHHRLVEEQLKRALSSPKR